MNIQKHLLSLLAGVLFAATAAAEVVYEPLVVDSGFNRDVIAEHPSVGGYAISALYYSGTTSCFATQSVIAARNANQGYTEEQYNRTVASGWPDNYLDTIRCNTEWGADALNYAPYDDPKLFWLLAPYDDVNALCLRPAKAGDEKLDDSDQLKGFQGAGTLKFKKIGCYNRLFFLLVSLRKGSVAPRIVTTTVYYTDGSTTSTTFTLTGGLSGEAKHKARMTNIFEGTFNKNKIAGTEAAYAEVFDIEVDYTKLIDHIHFSNPIVNSSVSILAITGVTADMEIPDEETANVSDISSNSFEACWEAIADAASYRLDVAEDYDFQHIIDGYNNLVVSGSTCQEVAGLIANNDYYWRVRSVNSAGGQSASSAPKHVKTQTAEGPQQESEESLAIEADMTELLNTTTNITINRTLYKDGCFNTLCLPFSLTTEEIAAHPKLSGCQLYTFDHADQIGDALIDVYMTEANAIEAGVPYLIKWANTGEVMTSLTFNSVTITTATGQSVGEEGHILFVGNIATAALTINDHNTLFVGGNNTLYWPNTDLGLKGFRAYFAVPAGGPSAVRKGTPARIVTVQNATTDVESIQHSEVSIQKIIRDGRVYILRDGKHYNVLGEEE